jgi:transcriptional regulator with XRE-family HTH domain
MVVNDLEDRENQIHFVIAQRLKRLRKEKKLSLDVLAERSGFSKSYLSQIETMNREPSIGTLTKIARTLGVDALFLISGIQPETEQSDVVIVRVDERKPMPVTFGQRGLKYESLAYKKEDRLMDAYILEMEPNFPKNVKPWQGETFVYTLEGKHEFIYNGKSYILNEGDCYYFNANKPYMGKRIGSKRSRILVVSTFTSGRKPIKS